MWRTTSRQRSPRSSARRLQSPKPRVYYELWILGARCMWISELDARALGYVGSLTACLDLKLSPPHRGSRWPLNTPIVALRPLSLSLSLLLQVHLIMYNQGLLRQTSCDQASVFEGRVGFRLWHHQLWITLGPVDCRAQRCSRGSGASRGRSTAKMHRLSFAPSVHCEFWALGTR